MGNAGLCEAISDLVKAERGVVVLEVGLCVDQERVEAGLACVLHRRFYEATAVPPPPVLRQNREALQLGHKALFVGDGAPAGGGDGFAAREAQKEAAAVVLAVPLLLGRDVLLFDEYAPANHAGLLKLGFAFDGFDDQGNLGHVCGAAPCCGVVFVYGSDEHRPDGVWKEPTGRLCQFDKRDGRISFHSDMKQPVYLDHNATTPVDERVLEQMIPYFSEQYGNASSQTHAYGWTAEEAVQQGREQVTGVLGAGSPNEIIFTSGATEAINTAIKGTAEAYGRVGRHIVTVKTEHKAVLDTCQALEHQDFDVTYLPVDEAGRVNPEEVADAITDETILVSVMWANNETGVLQPIPEIYERVHERGVLFMTDATQAVGKVPVSVEHADLLACSGHKFYGPKGVGALYVSRRSPRVRLVPLVDGGGQEDSRRGGTLNVPGIVGMGMALTLAQEEMVGEGRRQERLRDRFETRLREELSDIRINGAEARRLPQTTNVSFCGLKANNLMTALRRVAVSSGSACTSGSSRPSHVLKAMGLSDADAEAAIRFSLGRSTTEEDVDFAAEHVIDGVKDLRPTPVARRRQVS